MRYELAVLTHGASLPLGGALIAFRENVHPLPTRIRVFADGVADLSHVVGCVRGVFPDVEDPDVSATHPSRQAGFCEATARLWALAAGDEDVDYVFWLEHDFVAHRSVSLEQVAELLDEDDRLAQVALVRQACNDDEKRAGGLVQSRPPGTFSPTREVVHAEGVDWVIEWLQHRAFYTTNPSLMRRRFMVENPWPTDGEAHCEGRFGVDLVSRGYHFGYWGDGIPYVRHVGDRDGFGY